MAKPTAPWFEAMVWLELLFQVPFFVFAAAGFVARRNSVRIPCIIYGTSAATSVVAIVGDILASDEVTDPQRYKLICICEGKRIVLNCQYEWPTGATLTERLAPIVHAVLLLREL